VHSRSNRIVRGSLECLNRSVVQNACCSELQCVVVCSQSVAACCSVLQRVKLLQCVVVCAAVSCVFGECYSVMPLISVLQCVAVGCSMFAECCSVLQRGSLAYLNESVIRHVCCSVCRSIL